MAKFNLELDERELALLEGLIAFVGLFWRPFPEPYRSLVERVAALSGARANTSPPVGIPAAVTAAAPAPRSPEPPARSPSKPLAVTPMSSDGELVITPVVIDQPPDGKSIIVHYKIRAGNSVRMKKVHCWDPKQFGNIAETLNQPTTFLTKTTAKGFVNIVGVKR